MTQQKYSMPKPAVALLSLLLAVCLAAAAPASALFAATLDTAATGSITLDLQYDGEPVVGGTWAIYQVGEVSEDGTTWVLTQSFAGSGVDLAALLGDDDSDEESGGDGFVLGASADDLSRAAELLASYAAAANIQPLAAADNAGGVVVFTGLSVGVYLVVQIAESEGYELMAPFLITVPMSAGEGDDAAYVYDVNAYGKFTLVKKPPVPEEPEEETTTTSSTSSSEEEEEETVAPAPEEVPEIEEDEEISEEEAIEDEITETLPQTGQLNWPIPVLAVCGMGLMLTGWCIRRKEDKAENADASK